MNCNQIRELLPDLTTSAGMGAATPEVENHIASCAACAAHLREFQKTMALLEEWQAPEPSAYFDTRLGARLREEMARPAAGWLGWLRRPAWAMSAAGVVLAGALAVAIGMGGRSYIYVSETMPTKPPSLSLPVQPGTAVGDLEALQRNDELYADFDVLDELQVQDDETANP
jgi:predicted anti-sigma-YlaC factor YlaD